MTPCHRDSLRSTSGEDKQLAQTKINLHGAVSDASKGVAILEQTLLDILMSLGGTCSSHYPPFPIL